MSGVTHVYEKFNPDDVKLSFVGDAEEAADFMRWIGRQSKEILAFDTETTGLTWWGGTLENPRGIRLAQFGNMTEAWAIDIRRWRALVEDAVVAHNETARHGAPGTGWCGHNFPFDINFAWNEGIYLEGDKICTMLVSQLATPSSSHALKSLADKHVMKGSSAGQSALTRAMDKQGWGWNDIPVDFPIYWSYGALDTVLTRRLLAYYEHEYPVLMKSESFEIEMSVMPIMAAMQRRGIRIDQDYVQEKYTALHGFITACREWAKSAYDVDNITSNPQLAKRLLAEGVELTHKTGSGQWQLDKHVLGSIGHELARTALQVRKSTKVANTYFKNLMTGVGADMWNDIYMPSIRQCGAYTGRMSMRLLQLLPRTKLVRNAFIPRDGKRLLAADFDQVEMRVLYEYCRDPGLRDAIMSGDLHLATARRAYKDMSMTRDDPRRHTAKNAGFAKVYGAGVEQFARTCGISIDEASVFLAAYDEQFPGVLAFQQQCARLVETDGFLKSVFGRQHRPKDRDYATLNYLIQGTAAEVFKKQLIALDSAGFGDTLLVPVHDEIIAEIGEDDGSSTESDFEEIAQEFGKAMTYNGFDVPLTSTATVLNRWGDKYGDSEMPDIRDYTDEWGEKDNDTDV